MYFEGSYQPRSSKLIRTQDTAPGETEIQQLNPQRVARILAATNWGSLSPGSLNLRVDNAVLEQLAGLQVTLEELASEVVYPPLWAHIPTVRKAYWYYSATARRGNLSEPVLVRRAKQPLAGVVELFAAVSLTSTFQLAQGDVVGVEVHSKPHASA